MEQSGPLLLTATGAAKYLGISRPHFYKHVIEHVAKVLVGKDKYISRASLDEYVSKRLERPSDE